MSPLNSSFFSLLFFFLFLFFQITSVLLLTVESLLGAPSILSPLRNAGLRLCFDNSFELTSTALRAGEQQTEPQHHTAALSDGFLTHLLLQHPFFFLSLLLFLTLLLIPLSFHSSSCSIGYDIIWYDFPFSESTRTSLTKIKDTTFQSCRFSSKGISIKCLL